MDRWIVRYDPGSSFYHVYDPVNNFTTGLFTDKEEAQKHCDNLNDDPRKDAEEMNKLWP